MAWSLRYSNREYSKKNILVKNVHQPELLYNEEFVYAFITDFIRFNQTFDRAVVNTAPYILPDADTYDLVNVVNVVLYKFNFDTKVHEIFCRIDISKPFKRTDEDDWIEIKQNDYARLRSERLEYKGMFRGYKGRIED